MFAKDAVEVNVMDEFMDGTFDNLKTGRREVWVNGILAINIPAYALDSIRCGITGEKVNLSDWKSFPDNPNNS